MIFRGGRRGSRLITVVISLAARLHGTAFLWVKAQLKLKSGIEFWLYLRGCATSIRRPGNTVLGEHEFSWEFLLNAAIPM
jgi:hypothetical protein